MSGIQDTAYPQMKSAPSAREWADVYTPNFVELVWGGEADQRISAARWSSALPKTFQRLGYFVSLPEVPRPILEHVAQCAGSALQESIMLTSMLLLC
jgi:hypothetical protein